MVIHILVTTDTAKLTCGNVICDRISADISSAGLLSYHFTVVGGPGLVLQNSGTRSYRVCDPISIISSVAIIQI